MLISLAVAAAAFLWMAWQVVMVCTDPRADVRLPSGWYIAPAAVCALALIGALILWGLA